MKQILGGIAVAVLALLTAAGAAEASCAWAGNHWNCGDRAIYPKTYPWGTWVQNGQYAMPMLPPASDVNYPAAPASQPKP